MALAAQAVQSDEPFTVPHFRNWASELILDNGDAWVVEDYFEAYLEDYFAGIPECWLLVPEGNAKTTQLAGLAVYLLEHRPRASVLWAASSRDQAEIGYRQAELFVLGAPRLKRFMKCQQGYRRINNLDSLGRVQIFAADDRTGDGVIPTDAFLDELHRHRDLRLYRTWRGKLGKRRGQLGTISTAGEPGGEFEELREKIRQATPVVDRRPGFVRCRSPQIALHEYAVPEGADVEHMPTVKLANPFTGITVESLSDKFSTPTMTLAYWRRFVCNVPSRDEFAAIEEVEWANAKVTDPIPAGEPVWAGGDFAWKWDTTAIVPFWLRDPSFRLFGPAEVVVPPRDGTSLDPRLVKAAITRVHQRNPIHTFVMDMSRAEEIAHWLEQELGINVIDQSQGIPMQVQEYAMFMEALRNGWLKHTGDALLTRHALNAVARIQRGGDPIFERPVQSRRNTDEQDRRVIDALKAAAMVHRVAMQPSEPPPFRSSYETERLTVIGAPRRPT